MSYVFYLGRVPFEDLVALYQRAAFHISAVLYESSSLAILEAAGTPVIASRIPPNEEVAQTLQLDLFDPLDAGQLAGLILALWNDEATAAAQAVHNRQHVAFDSWGNAARKYVQFFGAILSA